MNEALLELFYNFLFLIKIVVFILFQSTGRQQFFSVLKVKIAPRTRPSRRNFYLIDDVKAT